MSFYMNGNNVTYFDSFGVEYIQKRINKRTGYKNIATHIYRIQAAEPIMCRYFCIGFIDFMQKGKSLSDYVNYFLLTNDKRILQYFQ